MRIVKICLFAWMLGAVAGTCAAQVSTYRELGVDLAIAGWYGLMAPAKTPAATVARIAKAAIEGVRSPDLRERLDGFGLETTGIGPAEFGARIREDLQKWGAAVRAAGYQPTL